MNHFNALFSLLVCFLVSKQIEAKNHNSSDSGQMEAFSEKAQEKPKDMNSLLSLADHYKSKNNWSMVIKTLQPVMEDLPKKGIKQLILAYTKLSQFQSAVSLIENNLLNKKKIKTKTYILGIRTYSALLTSIPNKAITTAVTSQKPSSPTSKKTPADKGATEKKEENEKITKTVLNRNAQIAEEKIFKLLKEAQTKDPYNVKIYDLWFEMLEKHVPNYAQEARIVFDDMKENKVKLRKRHYSKLCKYNSLSNLIGEAREICEQAVEIAPKNPDNFIYLGQAYINIGKKERGQRILASVGRKFSNSEEALWVTAKTHFENKDMVKAYRYYLKASRHKDAKPRNFLGLAKTAFELKKYKTSLKAFEQHCAKSHFLHQEFRKATGLLKDKPDWQARFRKKMENCNKKRGNVSKQYNF